MTNFYSVYILLSLLETWLTVIGWMQVTLTLSIFYFYVARKLADYDWLWMQITLILCVYYSRFTRKLSDCDWLWPHLALTLSILVFHSCFALRLDECDWLWLHLTLTLFIFCSSLTDCGWCLICSCLDFIFHILKSWMTVSDTVSAANFYCLYILFVIRFKAAWL